MASGPEAGLIDTSVLIALDRLAPAALPASIAIEAAFDALPFDEAAARAYGRIAASVMAAGRKVRGARAVDLLIAATALAHGLALVTLNPKDFDNLPEELHVLGLRVAEDDASQK